MVTPRLRHLLAQLDRAFAGPGEQKWAKFRGEYVQAIGAWLAAVRETATAKNRLILKGLEKSLPKRSEFSGQLKNGFGHDAWAARALSLVVNSEGVTTTLVGLRRPEHVQEALEVVT
jgi:hypothetical protein